MCTDGERYLLIDYTLWFNGTGIESACFINSACLFNDKYCNQIEDIEFFLERIIKIS